MQNPMQQMLKPAVMPTQQGGSASKVWRQPPRNNFGGGISGGNATFWTPPSGFEGATKPNQYDIGYISEGMGKLKDSAYNPTTYTPYQFKNVGPYGSDKYGKTSDKDISSMYQQAMNVATRPVIAQGQERMRQALQGWGANQMSSAAGKELAMKNAQATGSQVADIGAKIGSDISGRMLTQDETARGKEFDSRATARQADYNQRTQLQRDQAAENFRAAGFSEDQAKAMADDVYKRAGAMIGGGFNWINFQRGAGQDEYNKYNDAGFDESWI